MTTSRLSLLEESFSNNFKTKNFNNFWINLQSNNSGGSNVESDLDLFFRLKFDEFINELQNSDNNSKIDQILIEGSKIRQLIEFTFHLGELVCDSNSNVAKIPFILLEDLLESQNIENCMKCWKLIEIYVSENISNQFLSVGKLIILRLCNSLLRKLSKACHTEFCGKVLMFLAAIFNVTERSAVNQAGRFNTSNITSYEDEESYMTNIEAITNKEESNELDPNSINYSIYNTFWNLQSFLLSDIKAMEGKDKWSQFMSHTNVVFDTFESIKYSKNEIEQAELRYSKESSVNPSDDYMGCKFLTSSKLFSLQIHDVQLRLQIIAQLLFYIRYLHEKIRLYYDNKAIIYAGKKDVKLDKETIALETLYTSMKKDIIAVETRCLQLLKTTPNGNYFIALVSKVMDREGHWLAWKYGNSANSCPKFEIEKPIDLSVAVMDTADPSTTSEATTTGAASSGVGKRGGKKKKVITYYFDHSDAEIKENLKQLTKVVPEFKQYIKEYTDADDPENGIEEEYHPKKDSIYCWRARRMLASNKISVFESMIDGNLGNGIIVLNGGTVPEIVEEAVEPTLPDPAADVMETETEEVVAVADTKASSPLESGEADESDTGKQSPTIDYGELEASTDAGGDVTVANEDGEIQEDELPAKKRKLT